MPFTKRNLQFILPLAGIIIICILQYLNKRGIYEEFGKRGGEYPEALKAALIRSVKKNDDIKHYDKILFSLEHPSSDRRYIYCSKYDDYLFVQLIANNYIDESVEYQTWEGYLIIFDKHEKCIFEKDGILGAYGNNIGWPGVADQLQIPKIGKTFRRLFVLSIDKFFYSEIEVYLFDKSGPTIKQLFAAEAHGMLKLISIRVKSEVHRNDSISFKSGETGESLVLTYDPTRDDLFTSGGINDERFMIIDMNEVNEEKDK